MRAWAIILCAWTAAVGAEEEAPEEPPRPLVHVEVEVPLDFRSHPAGARVTVDGAARCQRTPCRRLTGMGEHEAVFVLEGEPPVRLRFRVPQEGPVQVDFLPVAHAGAVPPGPPAAPAAAEGDPPAAAVNTPSSGEQVAASAGPVPPAPEAVTPPSTSGLIRPSASDVGGREVAAQGNSALGASLARQWASLAFCHNVARAKDRAVPVRGRVVLEWTLLPSGRVEQVQVIHDSLGSPTVATCLGSQLARLRLPAGPGPVIVRYPVQFPLVGPSGAHLGVESRPAKR